MYEYCSVVIKKYSKYTIPSFAPNGFQSMLEPPQIDKWQHLSANCTLQFRVLLMDSRQILINVVLNNSTLLENIRLPLGDNQDLIQFSCKSPIISCKYISEEFGPRMLRRFQMNLPNDVEFNRTVVSLKNLNFVLRTARTSIAQSTITSQVQGNNNGTKVCFTEGPKVSSYTNPNTQFQTQNMIMDFSQRYQEESERESNNRSNITLPHDNIQIAQQIWPNTDLNVVHSSQDLNTPMATQTVLGRPESLIVQPLEVSQSLPNTTNCLPNAENKKKKVDTTSDFTSRKEIALCKTGLLETIHIPKERESQMQSVTGLDATPTIIWSPGKDNTAKKNTSNKKNIDDKLTNPQKSGNTHTPDRNKEVLPNGTLNETRKEASPSEGLTIRVKNVNRNASRKISKRLIKEKLKDEEFMKWCGIEKEPKAGMSLKDRYLNLELKLINKLQELPYVHQFIHDRISGRITLFLIVVGTLAFFNELYITIEMSLLQKNTSEELERGRIDESLKLHRMLVSDEYHGKEYKDEKSGIVIEEFEDRDKFFAKPVFVSELDVECNVIVDGKELLSTPLKFHVEFSPEDYENEKRPEFGTTLRVLRLRLYHYFKDCEICRDIIKNEGGEGARKFTISNGVKIYNHKDELLPLNIDDVQLCFLKIDTGNTIKCEFIL
ncbi:hypothetical protein SCAW_025610 [Saccharomyces cerevisiae]|nr:hypothetical protein SCAW_025610 [Saccharomyces cerevisiae]